jgi:hypothetical protein
MHNVSGTVTEKDNSLSLANDILPRNYWADLGHFPYLRVAEGKRNFPKGLGGIQERNET